MSEPPPSPPRALPDAQPGPALAPWVGWEPGLVGCEHARALGLLTREEIEACRAHYAKSTSAARVARAAKRGRVRG